MNKDITKTISKIFYIILPISLLIGFYFNEDGSGGGAKLDFNTTWQYILDLNENLIFHYMNWENIHLPLHYILMSFVYFFINEENYIRLFFCILSLLVPFLFYLNLRVKYSNIDKNLLIIFACILFLSPTFRYTAIWANLQITALIFFLLSLLFYLKWSEKNSKTIDFNLILQILFMTLATYTRQDYAIFYLFFMIVYFQKIEFKYFVLLSIFVIILSLPGLWFVYEQSSVLLNIKFTPKLHNYFLVNSSIMSLYLIPIFLLLMANERSFFKQDGKFIFLSIIFYTILVFILSSFFNYNYKLGGGFILKLSLILFDNYLLFYVSCIFGLASLTYLAKNNINNFVLISLLLFGYMGDVVFQKYFEPIFIFVFFLLLDTKISSEFLKKVKNIIFLYIYFFAYLSSAIINDLFELTKQI